MPLSSFPFSTEVLLKYWNTTSLTWDLVSWRWGVIFPLGPSAAAHPLSLLGSAQQLLSLCVCVSVFSSDACKQRCGQGVGYTPSAHRSDPWHPPGDAHHRRRRAGHRLRLPPPDLCSQPLPHRGEIGVSANQRLWKSDYLFSGFFIAPSESVLKQSLVRLCCETL